MHGDVAGPLQYVYRCSHPPILTVTSALEYSAHPHILDFQAPHDLAKDRLRIVQTASPPQSNKMPCCASCPASRRWYKYPGRGTGEVSPFRRLVALYAGSGLGAASDANATARAEALPNPLPALDSNLQHRQRVCIALARIAQSIPSASWH